MKKKSFILGSLVITAIIYILISSRTKENIERNNTVESQTEKAEYPLAAQELELSKIVDPNTGTVPDGALWKAFKQLEKQGKFTHDKPMLAKRIYPFGWKPVDDYFASLCISKIVYDPNNTKIFYFSTGEGWRNADAGRGAGIWKSTDGGESWFQLPSTDTSLFYYCQDILIHPTNSHIYIGTRSGGIQRSKDGGTTWEQVLGTNNGSLGNDVCDIELTKNGGIFVAIGISSTDGIYYSDNGDIGTWTKQTNGFPSSGFQRIELATAPSKDNVAFAIPVSTAYYGQKITGIFKTVDKGDTWFEVSNPGGDYDLAKTQGWYDLIITVDPNNDKVVVAGGIDLWRSTDGGYNWGKLSQSDINENRYVHVDQHEIVFVNSDIVYFGNDGGIWKSDNFTDEFPDIYNVNNNYNVAQFYSSAIHPMANNHIIIGGTQDNGSNMATDENTSDYHRLTKGDGSFCAINHNNGDIMFTTRQYEHVFRFDNGGYGNYVEINNPILNRDNTLFINPLEIDPNDPEILYMASSVGLWRLTNASFADGDDWEKATRNYGTISAIGIAKNIPNTVFIGRNKGGNIFRIDAANNTDDTYKPINLDISNTLPNAYSSCVCVDQNDANHVIVTYSNYGVKSIFESKNALSSKVSWVSVEGDLPDFPVRWALLHPSNSEVCYIATELGVFYTTKLNGENTVWLPTNTGLANTRVDMLRLRDSDNTVVAASHGRGLFTGKIRSSNNDYSIVWTERGPKNLGGRTRTIMIDPNYSSNKTIWAGSVSGGLWKTTNIDSIDYNYDFEYNSLSFSMTPNPVSSSGTKIFFYLEEKQHVILNIYDIRGKLISQILNEELEKGEYSHQWVPETDLRHGIYLIIIKAGKEKDTKKFTYINLH